MQFNVYNYLIYKHLLKINAYLYTFQIVYNYLIYKLLATFCPIFPLHILCILQILVKITYFLNTI